MLSAIKIEKTTKKLKIIFFLSANQRWVVFDPIGLKGRGKHGVKMDLWLTNGSEKGAPLRPIGSKTTHRLLVCREEKKYFSNFCGFFYFNCR